MTSEAHYREKLVHRARGVRELDRRVGGVFAEIDQRLARQQRVRVLELGCGYGTALLELRARYGEKVELHGLNRVHEDGNVDILLRNAREKRVFGDDAPQLGDLPSIAYGDASAGLPFREDYFDLVYSQVAWLYFGNKAAVLREVSRVLRADGIAKIDADQRRPGLPPGYRDLMEIWHQGRRIALAAYLRRFGIAFAAALDGEFLRFGKSPGVADDLELVFQIDLAEIHSHWDGIKCVYRMTSPGR